ncbi:DEAD/DEAH box helicase [Clostridium sp. AM58-1XD]|uniref:DEAD/DEAH box helicase n=1 Tax=Clostridium sp. AM58-1XD TaxID=2292307 RepID=UPI000E4BEC2C|nr:DEAD/DEAH box helicase [Clostridium sp. AM58-1XD]RGY97291.1 ATP-dependent helicase [Clostridium sp. AM58-1XD]
MEISEMTSNTFWKGEVGVKGLAEDQGQIYKASLYVKSGQVFDYSCSCKEGNSYKGMCRHCTALFEKWKKESEEKNGKTVYTSQEVRMMVREYTNREVARIIMEGEEEKVLLLPRLQFGRAGLQVEYRVGRDKTYVVRDLVAFVDALENGSLVEYGKNFSFHHNPEVFADECRPMVEFIIELVNTYREYYLKFQKGPQITSPAPALRQIMIGRTEMDRFFSIVMGQVLDAEDRMGISKKVVVEDGNPHIAVKAARAGKDGIRVSIDRNLACLEGEKYLYLMDQERIYRCDEECSSTLRVFVQGMIKSQGGRHEIEINERDIPLFYERVLQKVGCYWDISAEDVKLEDYRPEELKARFEFDSSGRNEVIMKPTLSYGDYSFHPIEDEKVPRTVCRDVPGEFRISQLISKYFRFQQNESHNLIIKEDEDGIYRLLTQGIPEFMTLGEVYVSEGLGQLKVIPPPKMAVGVKSVGNWLELTIDAPGMSRQDLVHLLSEYQQKKKYYRLKNGEFLQLEGGSLLTVARLVEGLAVSKTELQKDKVALPRYRAVYLNSILKEESSLSFYRDQAFKSIVRGMKSVEDSDFEIPASIKPILRGYQKVGFRWLKTLDYYGFGGILADDMGLGKTIQVIALLLDEEGKHRNKEEESASGPADKKPSLIVCPASLVYNWENEIARFAPELKILTVAGTAEERRALLEMTGDYDVLITSYDLLRRDLLLYEDKKFCFQVIDEAQYIKNAGTQSAKAVKAVDARTKYALTGTPIENRLSELWSIFDYLMPGFLFSYQKFRREFELPVVRGQDRDVLSRLHKMIGPFILRRLKTEVLKELPEKLETVVYSRFEKEQRELYAANASLLKKQLEDGGGMGRDKLQILAGLTRLRQICCDPSLCYQNFKGESAKLETCIDLVKDGVSGGHKILLFSQFTSMLEIIGKRLRKEEIEYHVLTGDTPKEERLKLVDSFHRDDTPVFLISLKAGGTGLNLTAADVVIHYDPWWNVAAQNQATDRVYRIGQERQVSVFKLITKNTIEENILSLQESKKTLAEQIISEGTVSLASLSKSDLMELRWGLNKTGAWYSVQKQKDTVPRFL